MFCLLLHLKRKKKYFLSLVSPCAQCRVLFTFTEEQALDIFGPLTSDPSMFVLVSFKAPVLSQNGSRNNKIQQPKTEGIVPIRTNKG